MARIRYVFAVLTVVCVPPAIAWWFVVHPFIRFWRRVGTRVTFTVMTVLMLGWLVGLFRMRAWLVGADLGTHRGLVGVAVALVIGSSWIALKRRKDLTVRTLAGVPELQRDGRGGRLLTEGLYRLIRHPRYVEVALGTLAYAAFANYSGAWIVALATLPLLHLIVVLEERELAQRFGEEYEEYRSRVPRYVPRWRR